MNKLLVSDIIELKEGIYLLEVKSNKLKIITNGNVTIYLINTLINNLDLLINDNSYVNMYIFNKNVNNKLVINILEDNNTKIDLRYAFINNNDYECIINNNIKGHNNNSNINIRNISNKGLSKVIINAFIEERTTNNIALEDLKGINNGGLIHIEPNIICNSNEVSANHLTTIGSFNKDIINYLMSKGIKEELAKDLLLKGFLYSNMDDYIKSVEVI